MYHYLFVFVSEIPIWLITSEGQNSHTAYIFTLRLLSGFFAYL